MTTIKKTADEVLKNIYDDNRVNTIPYSKLDALNELKNAIEFMIMKIELTKES
jgi:hypothetical protein